MSSKLQSIVENGEINDLVDVVDAKKIVEEAMFSQKNRKEVRKFLYDLKTCETLYDVQRLTYNAYLKKIGMKVL